MGWGCYKHEIDSDSHDWGVAMDALSERKLKERPRTFGRGLAVCPLCWNEMEAEVSRLRAALLRYGHHDDGCASWEDGPKFCTCGFGAELEKE